MKKLISVMLALVLVLSLATVAFAASETSANFTKIYTVTGGNTTPTETIAFNVVAASGNPDMTKLISIAPLSITGTSNTATITLPQYTTVGKYNYTVTEVPGSSQGVTYSTTPFNVQVLAYWNDDHSAIETDIEFTTAAGEGKLESFTNLYDLGSLTVKKTVSGNLASQEADFTITITLTAEEGKTVNSDITVTGSDTEDTTTNKTIAKGWTGSTSIDVVLKHNETVTLSNIPAGVTYTVVESSAHKLADGATVNANSAADEDYTASGEVTTAASIAAGDTDSVTINNEKSTSVDTGITLDSMPFVLMLVVCAGAAVLFVTKRRSVEF